MFDLATKAGVGKACTIITEGHCIEYLKSLNVSKIVELPEGRAPCDALGMTMKMTMTMTMWIEMP